MMRFARRSAMLLAVAAVFLGRPAAAQTGARGPDTSALGAEGIRVVTIREAVDSALASGEDRKIVDGKLAAARAAYDLAMSKKGPALSASGAYSYSDEFGEDLSIPAVSKLVGAKGSSHKIEAGASLAFGASSSQSQNSKLSLSAAQTIPGDNPGSTTLGASLAQTIWDGFPGGQFKASLEKAAIALEKMELETGQSRSAIASDVKKAYVAMLTAQRTVALRTSALERQSSSLKQIDAMFALQQASAVDLMNARALARAAELDLEVAMHDQEIARRRMAALMGRDPSDRFAAAELDEPELPARSIEGAIALGLEKRSDAAKSILDRRSAAIDLALTKASSSPSVSASAALAMGILGGSTPGEAFQASLGVKVSGPILDSGAAAAQIAAAEAQLSVLDAQARKLARTIETEIRDVYRTASILRDRIEVAAAIRDVYEKKLELVKTQLQFGTATNQDLLSAQSDAAAYGAAYLRAMGDYLLKVIDLETAMGL